MPQGPESDCLQAAVPPSDQALSLWLDDRDVCPWEEEDITQLCVRWNRTAAPALDYQVDATPHHDDLSAPLMFEPVKNHAEAKNHNNEKSEMKRGGQSIPSNSEPDGEDSAEWHRNKEGQCGP